MRSKITAPSSLIKTLTRFFMAAAVVAVSLAALGPAAEGAVVQTTSVQSNRARRESRSPES